MTYTNLSASPKCEQARQIISQADHILIGAGAGLTTAAGLRYDGEEFEREFRPWIERYGFTDLYTSGFYPFGTDEERWAYWARHIWFARYRVGALPLYEELRRLVEGRDYFVITTNVDAQFLKAGFDPERLFYTQGDYAFLQDATGEDRKLYYNEEIVRRMMAATTSDLRIPTEMIPLNPANGHKLTMNLRSDSTFVEDDNWREMCLRYETFVGRAGRSGGLVLLEFGVGFNTPVIIRYPFEQMATLFDRSALIRFNPGHPQLTVGSPDRYICFQEEIDARLLRAIMGRG